jgi:hypothetical protein
MSGPPSVGDLLQGLPAEVAAFTSDVLRARDTVFRWADAGKEFFKALKWLEEQFALAD